MRPRLRKKCQRAHDALNDLLDADDTRRVVPEGFSPDEIAAITNAMNILASKTGLAWNATDQRWEK